MLRPWTLGFGVFLWARHILGMHCFLSWLILWKECSCAHITVIFPSKKQSGGHLFVIVEIEHRALHLPGDLPPSFIPSCRVLHFVWIGLHVPCGGHSLTEGVFFNSSLSYSLETGSLTNLGAQIWLCCLNNPLGFPCLCLSTPHVRIMGTLLIPAFYMGTRDLNWGPHTHSKELCWLRHFLIFKVISSKRIMTFYKDSIGWESFIWKSLMTEDVNLWCHHGTNEKFCVWCPFRGQWYAGTFHIQ